MFEHDVQTAPVADWRIVAMKSPSPHPAFCLGLTFIAGLLFVMSSVAIAGAPLKGVDIKLGKNPGGGLASRTTDVSGGFNFGVVPKGSYRITVAAPAGSELAKTRAVEVIVYSAAKAPVSAVLGPSGAARKSGAVEAADFMVIASDGVHPIRGYASSTDSSGTVPVAQKHLHGIVSLIK
jgi:hypothetical protein